MSSNYLDSFLDFSLTVPQYKTNHDNMALYQRLLETRNDNNNNTIKMYYIAEKHRTTCIYYEKAACTYQRPSASRVPLSLWSALGGYITAFDIEFQSSSLPSYYLGTMLDRVIQSSTNSLEHITIKGGNVRDYVYDI